MYIVVHCLGALCCLTSSTLDLCKLNKTKTFFVKQLILKPSLGGFIHLLLVDPHLAKSNTFIILFSTSS